MERYSRGLSQRIESDSLKGGTMKKYLFLLLVALLLLVSCEEAGKVNYDALEMIEWKGNLSEAPADPLPGWMYYNTTECVTYLFDGNIWKIVSNDAHSITAKIDGEEVDQSPYYFPFDGEPTSTKTITITNTGTVDLYLSEEGPIAKSYPGAFISEVEANAPSWKTCLKPQESLTFTVKFTRLDDDICDGATVSIKDSKGNTIWYKEFYSDSIIKSSESPLKYAFVTAYSWDFCHVIEENDSYFMYNPIIDFGNMLPDSENKVLAMVEIQNSTEEVITLEEDSIAWIDGADASSFRIAVEEGTTKLYPGKWIPLIVAFIPESSGEKNAVLHITIGDSSNETFDIKLYGRATDKLFEESDCMPLNSTYDSGYSNTKPLITGGENNGNFYVQRGIYIREYSNEGKLLQVFTLPYTTNYDFFDYKNDKFYLYSTSPYAYSVYNPTTNTFEEKNVSITEQEYSETSGKGNGFVQFQRLSQRIMFGEYSLDFIDELPNILFISKDEERIGSLAGLVEYNPRNDYCVSGDYLYWASDCFVKRVNIKDLIENL